jgi:hypothetical protein
MRLGVEGNDVSRLANHLKPSLTGRGHLTVSCQSPAAGRASTSPATTRRRKAGNPAALHGDVTASHTSLTD